MNRIIIQKIIDALNIGTPEKVMYAIGALDTLMETLPKIQLPVGVVKEIIKSENSTLGFVASENKNMSEAEVLNKEAEARLKNIKDIA